MDNCTSADNLTTATKNTIAETASAPLSSNTPYREDIGSHLCAANITRRDVAYAVNQVSRKVANPSSFGSNQLSRLFCNEILPD